MVRRGEVKEVSEDTIKVSVNNTTRNEREVSDYNNYGVDSLPQKGAKGLLLSLREKAHKILVGIKRKTIDRKAKPGETRLYNAFGAEVYLKDNGDIVATTSGGAILTIKEDGDIEINGNVKSAMLWEDFNTVWTAFMTHYKAHTHTVISLGSATSTIIVPITGTQENMSPAKSDKIKLGAND